MRKALALCLLLALSAQAQRLVDVTAARLHTADGGVEDVAGGAWLDDSQLSASGKELAQLRTENKNLADHAGDMPTRWVIGAFVVGALLGAGTVIAITQLRKGP